MIIESTKTKIWHLKILEMEIKKVSEYKYQNGILKSQNYLFNCLLSKLFLKFMLVSKKKKF